MYHLLFPLFVLFLVALQTEGSALWAQEKQEETYSISLIQAAEADKQVREIDGRKILTEPYKVRSGDHLWRILQDKGLLKDKHRLNEVIRLLKSLNSSLTNLDLLHPGETIIIPLIVTPVRGNQPSAPKVEEPPLPLTNLKEADAEYYTIRAGDSLVKVIKNKYNLTDKEIHDEFLNILMKMNPGLENPNKVFPGQKIRLPIYSPQVVRMPLPPLPPAQDNAEEVSKEEPFPFISQVTAIFKEMGVEWVDAGQHFIPLKSGGQINLNADSFPIINLPNGNRIIIDPRGGLPERMGALITSNWGNYKIVRLKAHDSLREAIGKILIACDYQKVLRANETLDVPGNVSLHLKGDWIVQTTGEDPSKRGPIVVLRLVEQDSARTPWSLKRMLQDSGIRVVEFPPLEERNEPTMQTSEVLKAGSGPREVVQKILQLTGQNFSRDMEISVMQSKKEEFSLLVKADFVVSREGKENIIDLSGLGPEIITLLREHAFGVLSLQDRQDPLSVISGVLDFAGIPFDPNPHTFFATEEKGSAGISVTVPCITFSAEDGRKILVPPFRFPETLHAFLSEKGYNILETESP